MEKLMRDAVDDFLKVWLYTDGPDKILAWAASKNPYISWEGNMPISATQSPAAL
jgi:hypothetical protein